MISTISETATVNKIELQEELYNNEEKEEKKIDTQKTIQRQMKKFSDNVNFQVIQRINFTNQTLLLVI